MLERNHALRDLRRRLVAALDDHPKACALVERTVDRSDVLRLLARLHAAAVAAADGAEELVRVSASMAAAHLSAAHKAADAGRAPDEPLQAHVAETFAATAGRDRVAALRARAAWQAELAAAVDRERLDADVDALAARRPPLETPEEAKPRSRVSPSLLAQLDVSRVREALSTTARPSVPHASVSPPSWLYVPALRHRLGGDGPDGELTVTVALPAFWIARRTQAAASFASAVALSQQVGAEVPLEVAWEAAARLVGPWLVRESRWEWCSDPHDRRLMLRTAALGPHEGRGDGDRLSARTLDAPSQRHRLPARGDVADAGVRPVRIVRGEVRA